MNDGQLAGSVKDIRTMQPIPNAKISAQPEGGGDSHPTTSGDNGDWGPMSVAPGTYDMKVVADGYDDGIYPGIVVLENVTTTLPFVLHPVDLQH